MQAALRAGPILGGRPAQRGPPENSPHVNRRQRRCGQGRIHSPLRDLGILDLALEGVNASTLCLTACELSPGVSGWVRAQQLKERVPCLVDTPPKKGGIT